MIFAEQLTVRRPKRLKEALKMLADEPDLAALAGGTDLFVTLNAGVEQRKRFLDLWELKELRGEKCSGRSLELGALTTFTECVESRTVRRLLPILVEAARQVGGVQIQNRGTLGGNIGNGSPAGDSLPVLMAADARIVLSSVLGDREVPFTEFYTGYRKSVCRPSELITRILIDVPKGKQSFRKVGTRAAQAISKVVLARIGHRVAVGSVAPTVIRLPRTEAVLREKSGDRSALEAAIVDEIHPIDDVRSTAEYRQRILCNLLTR
jgi:CO/xanthine dehydrogenase FAD-binding subunit